jgi:hypothetical protein
MFMDAEIPPFHKGTTYPIGFSNINYKLVLGSWWANARN